MPRLNAISLDEYSKPSNLITDRSLDVKTSTMSSEDANVLSFTVIVVLLM